MFVNVLNRRKRNTPFVIFPSKLSIRLGLSIEYEQQVIGTIRASAPRICDISNSPTRVFRASPETESCILNGKCRFVKKTPKKIWNVV